MRSIPPYLAKPVNIYFLKLFHHYGEIGAFNRPSSGWFRVGEDDVCGARIDTSENENRLKIEFELDGEKAVCVCDEEKFGFYFSGKPFDMLFKYNNLRNTVIKEIGESTVIYGHGEAEYGIKLTCGVKSEQNGYRISPDTNSFEISFLRL